MNNGYVTNDIFRAAALIIKTDKYPDGYYMTGEVVGGRPLIYMAWDDMSVDLVKQLDAGELLVCPIKLAYVYRRLRGKLIEQSKGQDNGQRTPTVKAG